MYKYKGLTKAYYVEQLRGTQNWYLEALSKERTDSARQLDLEVNRLTHILDNWATLAYESE